MWRLPSRALLALSLLGVVGLLYASPPSAWSPPSLPPSCAHVSLAENGSGFAVDCSIPVGWSGDPCSTVSLGQIHCPFSIPSLNPADWAGYLVCQIGSLTSQLLSDLNQKIAMPVENATVGAIDAIGSVFDGIESGIANLAADAGPLAPIVAVAMTALLILGALVVLYFLGIALIAGLKTLFNLL